MSWSASSTTYCAQNLAKVPGIERFTQQAAQDQPCPELRTQQVRPAAAIDQLWCLGNASPSAQVSNILMCPNDPNGASVTQRRTTGMQPAFRPQRRGVSASPIYAFGQPGLARQHRTTSAGRIRTDELARPCESPPVHWCRRRVARCPLLVAETTQRCPVAADQLSCCSGVNPSFNSH